MPELLSIRAYARQRGVSHVAILKAAKSGRITLVDGKVDPATADQQWKANTNPGQSQAAASRVAAATQKAPDAVAPAGNGQGPPGAPGGNGAAAGPTYAVQRAIREGYMARLARIEYELKSGRLVEADKVRVKAFNAARRAREMLLGLPDRLSPQLAGETNTFEIHRILTEELRRICTEISHARAV
jgi:hypothetical protein